jgi:hypothetical protein
VAELSWEATAAATAEVYREAIAEGRAGRRPSRPREDRP